MDKRNEWGVICTNCLSQFRHNEYEANEHQLFICPNCGVTEHFREWILPKKRRFKFQMQWFKPLIIQNGDFHKFREIFANKPDELL